MNALYLTITALLGVGSIVIITMLIKNEHAVRLFLNTSKQSDTAISNTSLFKKGKFLRKAPAEPAWDEIQAYLPDGWHALNHIPPEFSGRLEPVSAPFAEAIVRGAMNTMPSIANTVNSSRLFQLVGPPEVFTGLDAGTLSFMVDKSGKQMMDLVDNTHVIRHKARVVSAGGQINATAVAAGVFQLLSVATAQYYLHQITQQLQDISAKLDDIVGKLDDLRYGKVVAAMQTIEEVYNGALQELKHDGIEYLNASQEYWTRMANAEQALREVIAECERDYSRNRTIWLGKMATPTEGGWKPRKTIKRDDIKTFKDIEQWTATVGQIHTMASFAIFQWYQVTLAHDSMTSSDRLRSRYNGLMTYMSKRVEFWEGQVNDQKIYLKNEGTHMWDDIKDVLSISAGAGIGVTIIPAAIPAAIPAIIARKTDKEFETQYKQLTGTYQRQFESILPIIEMKTRKPQPFFIVKESGVNEDSYRLLRLIP